MSIFPGWLRLGTKSANLKAALFPMNLRFPFLSAVAAVALLSTSTPQALQAKSDAEQICVSVGRLLEEGHYTHQQLNAEMSQKFLRNYLELLDFSHLFFTQKDVDALRAKYGPLWLMTFCSEISNRPTRFTISTKSASTSGSVKSKSCSRNRWSSKPTRP